MATTPAAPSPAALPLPEPFATYSTTSGNTPGDASAMPTPASYDHLPVVVWRLATSNPALVVPGYDLVHATNAIRPDDIAPSVELIRNIETEIATHAARNGITLSAGACTLLPSAGGVTVAYCWEATIDQPTHRDRTSYTDEPGQPHHGLASAPNELQDVPTELAELAQLLADRLPIPAGSGPNWLLEVDYAATLRLYTPDLLLDPHREHLAPLFEYLLSCPVKVGWSFQYLYTSPSPDPADQVGAAAGERAPHGPHVGFLDLHLTADDDSRTVVLSVGIDPAMSGLPAGPATAEALDLPATLTAAFAGGGRARAPFLISPAPAGATWWATLSSTPVIPRVAFDDMAELDGADGDTAHWCADTAEDLATALIEGLSEHLDALTQP